MADSLPGGAVAIAEDLPASIARYRILCELGSGGMATVYLGRAVGLGRFERLVAIKMIHPHLCRQRGFVELFLNEARIAAAIHHPNVVAVHDIDMHGGRHYFAMDYVSGETLGEVLNVAWRGGEGSFPVELGAHIVVSAADGLHAAHELEDAEGRRLDAVHRDVAPQNIMVRYDGIVRVIDFGIAKALDRSGATRPGTWRGTPAYMAPEQVRGRPMDRRVDVFGLGVVLWELCVGERLFKLETELGTVARILHMAVPPPSSRRSSVPSAVDAIVMRALERDPEARYPTARALADDLRAFAASSGCAASAGDLARFQKSLFAARYEKRLAMERHASARIVPARVEGIRDDEPKTRELRITQAPEAEPIDDPAIAREMLEPVRSGRRRPTKRVPTMWCKCFHVDVGIRRGCERRRRLRNRFVVDARIRPHTLVVHPGRGDPVVVREEAPVDAALRVTAPEHDSEHPPRDVDRDRGVAPSRFAPLADHSNPREGATQRPQKGAKPDSFEGSDL